MFLLCVYVVRTFAFVLLGLVIIFHFSPYQSYLFFLNKSLDLKSVRCRLMNIDFVHLHFREGKLVLKYVGHLGFSRMFLKILSFFFREAVIAIWFICLIKVRLCMKDHLLPEVYLTV